MTMQEGFGYLSCPSSLPKSLLFLRLESALIMAKGKPPEGCPSRGTLIKLRASLESSLRGLEIMTMRRMEKVAEKFGLDVGDVGQWGLAMVTIAPEWYHRPETCTGTTSNPGSADRLLQYRRRAKRGRSVFNHQDQSLGE